MAVDPHPAYLAAVQHAYEVLDDNFDDLYQQCTTTEQRQSLRSLHAAARDTYWRAVAVDLKDNSPVVREIFSELTQANQDLRELIANLQNISAFIALFTQAVRLAASLVTLATVA
mgnify:FL=1|jgi:hypothetical protein